MGNRGDDHMNGSGAARKPDYGCSASTASRPAPGAALPSFGSVFCGRTSTPWEFPWGTGTRSLNSRHIAVRARV